MNNGKRTYPAKRCPKCGGPLGGTTNTSAIRCIHGNPLKRHCCQCYIPSDLVAYTSADEAVSQEGKS